MSLTSLYRIYKVALWASDQLATATVLKKSIDSCVKAIADKQFALERELRFR